MQITKYYKFYYGHRNQSLKDKCSRLHGHIAQLYITFEVYRNGDITTLFDEFDSKIEPLLKNEYDHRTLIDVNDPFYTYVKCFEEETGESMGMKVLPFPTSVENVCFYLFHQITKMGFNIYTLKFQETQSSTVHYTYYDYQNDLVSDLGYKLNLHELAKSQTD